MHTDDAKTAHGYTARVLLFGFVVLLALAAVAVLQSSAGAQSDGSFIRQRDTRDVYRVKLVDGKRFKRLMLREAAFCAYADVPDACTTRGESLWHQVDNVPLEVMDSYETSWLARLGSNDEVYEFRRTGDNLGERRHLAMEPAEFDLAGYDWDSVFSTEPGDFYAYAKRGDITCADLDVCDPVNLPPVIDAWGPLTLIEGQMVSGQHMATVTDPDNTLAPSSIGVGGLPRFLPGWTLNWSPPSGRLTISGTVALGTAGTYPVTVSATDGPHHIEETFSISVEPDGSPPPVSSSGPFFASGPSAVNLSTRSLQPGDTLDVTVGIQCPTDQSLDLWLLISLKHTGKPQMLALNDSPNDSRHDCPRGTPARLSGVFAVPSAAPFGEYLVWITLSDANVGKSERVAWYRGSTEIFNRDSMLVVVEPVRVRLSPLGEPNPGPFSINLQGFIPGLLGETGGWISSLAKLAGHDLDLGCDLSFEAQLGCMVWSFFPITDAIDVLAWFLNQCAWNGLIRNNWENCSTLDIGLQIFGLVPFIGDVAEFGRVIAKLARLDLTKALALLRWDPFEQLLDSQHLEFLGGAKKIRSDIAAKQARESLDTVLRTATRGDESTYGILDELTIDPLALKKAAIGIEEELGIGGLTEAVQANPVKTFVKQIPSRTDEVYTGWVGLFDTFRKGGNAGTGAKTQIKAAVLSWRNGWRLDGIEEGIQTYNRWGWRYADTVGRLPSGEKFLEEVKTNLDSVVGGDGRLKKDIIERLDLAKDWNEIATAGGNAKTVERFMLTVDETKPALQKGLFEAGGPSWWQELREAAIERDLKVSVRYIGGGTHDLVPLTP